MCEARESDWSKLSNPVKTILERIDINRESAEVKIGDIIDIPFFKGVLTEEMADEIISYQYSDENEGHYSASKTEGVLTIKFLKRAF
jgi:hypothetical protein